MGVLLCICWYRQREWFYLLDEVCDERPYLNNLMMKTRECLMSLEYPWHLQQDLDLREILAETERRGMTFNHLLTIPEQDEWVYSDGKSTTCVSFILEMYKEAGIFGPISNSIQVTEFTVST